MQLRSKITSIHSDDNDMIDDGKEIKGLFG